MKLLKNKKGLAISNLGGSLGKFIVFLLILTLIYWAVGNKDWELAGYSIIAFAIVAKVFS